MRSPLPCAPSPSRRARLVPSCPSRLSPPARLLALESAALTDTRGRCLGICPWGSERHLRAECRPRASRGQMRGARDATDKARSQHTAAAEVCCVLRTSIRSSCTLVVSSSSTRCCCLRVEAMSVRVLPSSGRSGGETRPWSSFVLRLLPRARRWYRYRLLRLGDWLTPGSLAKAEDRRGGDSPAQTLPKSVAAEPPAMASSRGGRAPCACGATWGGASPQAWVDAMVQCDCYKV